MFSAQSLSGPGRRWIANTSLAAHHVNWRKAAKDKALGVEGNFTRNLQTLVLVHFCFRRIEGRLVGPHLPREDNLLIILRIDGATEIRIFATGDIILPSFDDLDASIFLKDGRPVLGPFAIGLHLLLGHRDHESCDIHGSASFDETVTIAQGAEDPPAPSRWRSRIRSSWPDTPKGRWCAGQAC